MGIVINALMLGGGEAVAFIFVANATPNTEIYATANKTYHATADANGKACIAVGETGAFTLTNGILTASVTVPANGGVVQASLHVRRTGSVVSFNTPSSIPLLSLVGEINPVQNLNGYDHPWAGGAGKNLLSPFTKGVSIVSSTGALNSNATHATTDKIYVDFSQNPNYYLSGMLTTLRHFVAAYNSSDQFLGRNSAGALESRKLTPSSFIYGTPQGSGDVAYIRITIYENTGLSGVIDDIDNMTAQLEAGSSSTTYEPYSNICPISGFANANICLEDEYDAGATPAYTINLGETRYGGSLNVTTGVLTLTHGYIASYNSEVLPSTWISDRDEYAVGTTPTTGAEVVYELATPTTVQLTAQQINTLVGDNVLWMDTGDITVEY